MHIDQSEWRNREYRICENAAVRRDDAEIAVQGAQRLEKCLVAQPFGLQHAQPVLRGEPLDRSWLRMVAAPACAVETASRKAAM